MRIWYLNVSGIRISDGIRSLRRSRPPVPSFKCCLRVFLSLRRKIRGAVWALRNIPEIDIIDQRSLAPPASARFLLQSQTRNDVILRQLALDRGTLPVTRLRTRCAFLSFFLSFFILSFFLFTTTRTRLRYVSRGEEHRGSASTLPPAIRRFPRGRRSGGGEGGWRSYLSSLRDLDLAGAKSARRARSLLRDAVMQSPPPPSSHLRENGRFIKESSPPGAVILSFFFFFFSCYRVSQAARRAQAAFT